MVSFMSEGRTCPLGINFEIDSPADAQHPTIRVPDLGSGFRANDLTNDSAVNSVDDDGIITHICVHAHTCTYAGIYSCTNTEVCKISTCHRKCTQSKAHSVVMSSKRMLQEKACLALFKSAFILSGLLLSCV
jgi:hypothetical protein